MRSKKLWETGNMTTETPVSLSARAVVRSRTGLARALTAAVFTLAMAPGFALAQSPAGEIIIDFGSQAPPPATNVCETGDAKAFAWMSVAPVQGTVWQNVNLFLDGTALQPNDAVRYYDDASPAGQARALANWRDAQSQFRSIKSQLENLARTGHTNWQPACEACNRFRAWWDLLDVAAKQRDDLSKRTTADGPKSQAPNTLVERQLAASNVAGVTTYARTVKSSIDVTRLTQAQVEFPGDTSGGATTFYAVQLLVRWYNELATKRPTAVPSSPDAQACLKNMLPSDDKAVPNVNQCRLEHYEQGMDFLVRRLVQSLEQAARSSPTSFAMKQLLKDSKRLYDTACPGDSYPNNWRLRQYE